MNVFNWLVEQLGLSTPISDLYVNYVVIVSACLLAVAVVLLFCSLIIGIVSNTFRR